MSERGLQPCHEPYNMQGMPGACCRNQVPQRHSTDSVCSLLDVVLAETLAVMEQYTRHEGLAALSEL